MAKCSGDLASDASAEGAGAPEIEITPAMIEVGIERLFDLKDGPVPRWELVREIFEAMWAARSSHTSRE